MFHLFVPSEAGKKSWKEKNADIKKNADLIFLSRIQEPLEGTTEISDEETINTYVFKIGDLVKFGETVGRIVSGDGSTYTVETSEGHQRPMNTKEMFLTTEGEQKAQIEEKISILQAKIDEKNVELEEIKRLVQIEIIRNELKAAEDAYRATMWDSGNKLKNTRKNILTQLRNLLPEAPVGTIDTGMMGEYLEYDENATVKKLLMFKVKDLVHLHMDLEIVWVKIFHIWR